MFSPRGSGNGKGEPLFIRRKLKSKLLLPSLLGLWEWPDPGQEKTGSGMGERLDLGWEKGWIWDGTGHGIPKPFHIPLGFSIQELDAASIPEVFHVGLKDGAESRDFSTFVALSREWGIIFSK